MPPEASTPRRSTRIRAEIAVRVTSLDPAVPFSEPCQTVIVNLQGCGLRVTRPIEPSTPLRIEELPGGGSVTAQAANCVPLGTDGKFWLVGAELDEPGNVWGIQSPPADWTMGEAPAAKNAESGKKKNWPYSAFPSPSHSRPK